MTNDDLELGSRVTSELIYENELGYWRRLFFILRRTESWEPLEYRTLLSFVRRGLTVRHVGEGASHFAICGCGWRSENTGKGLYHARHLALTEHPTCHLAVAS